MEDYECCLNVHVDHGFGDETSRAFFSQVHLDARPSFISLGCLLSPGDFFNRFILFSGTSVLQVTASDADDPTYGNSARIVYSILQGQPYFSVDPKTGNSTRNTRNLTNTVTVNTRTTPPLVPFND